LLSIKNNLVKTISVKSGLVYEGKKFRNTTKRYEEIISRTLRLKNLSFVSILLVKNADQLLVRPIELYEFPYPNILRLDSQTNFDDKSIFKLESKALYFINQIRVSKAQRI
jgi:hypothetical protein